MMKELDEAKSSLATATTTVDTVGDTESLHERGQSLVQQHKD